MLQEPNTQHCINLIEIKLAMPDKTLAQKVDTVKGRKLAKKRVIILCYSAVVPVEKIGSLWLLRKREKHLHLVV